MLSVNPTYTESAVSSFNYCPPTNGNIGGTIYTKPDFDKSGKIVVMGDCRVGTDLAIDAGAGRGYIGQNSAALVGVLGIGEVYKANEKTQVRNSSSYPRMHQLLITGAYLGAAGETMTGNRLYASISGRGGIGYAYHSVEYKKIVDNQDSIINNNNSNWGVYLNCTAEAGIRAGKNNGYALALFTNGVVASPASKPTIYMVAFGIKASTNAF